MQAGSVKVVSAAQESVSKNQVSKMLPSTMSTGTRQEADKADDAVVELVRRDLHGRGRPLTDWQQFPD